MSEHNPTYLYKYRPVTDTKNLKDDLNLKALFSCEAVFSGRKAFNDLFDSKVHFIKPTPRQFKALIQQSNGKTATKLKKFIAKGKFTYEGDMYVMKETEKLNNLIDSYRFYCFSANPVSNLMWSHYADCHRGFCIEFKWDYFKPDKIDYADQIPEFDLIKFFGLELRENSNTGIEIWNCLRTKLNEWRYEEEYRFQASNAMREFGIPIESNTEIEKYLYPQDAVESIIFGCKMPASTKKFIKDEIPFKVKFKQAKELKSSIQIVDDE
ncbi:DUF2971 domain-containing protein [Undibacterium sp. MH2W]|uniref:DUF2971 domain-containing protein n=1 Tax=Undibacterium sp. MH2W TaxID=3413044 RepID=UPI003BF34281